MAVRAMRAMVGAMMGIAVTATACLALAPCPIDGPCAELSIDVPASPVNPGDTALLHLSFVQGEDDQQPGGVDEVAAVVVSVGLPGLELADCSPPDAGGLNSSFTLLPGAAGRYRVVVQNLRCAGRVSCLCPGDGDTRDAYVNLLIVGLPQGGSLQPLPNGEVVSVGVRVPSATQGPIPVHIFTALDDPATPPPGAGTLSVADSGGIDRTVNQAAGTLNVRLTDGVLQVGAPTSPTVAATNTATAPATNTATPTATATATATVTATASLPPTQSATATETETEVPLTPTATAADTATATATAAAPTCVGDCNGSGDISVNELVIGVGIALDTLPLSSCPAFDCRGSGRVEVACLIAAVNAALDGCPPS